MKLNLFAFKARYFDDILLKLLIYKSVSEI